MKTDQIFIGNINKCTKYINHTTFSSGTFIGDQCIGCDSFGYIEKEDEIYKENAILIKLKNGGYVDLENLNSIFDHLKVLNTTTRDGFYLGGIIMSTSAHCVGSIFVDQKSLVPYYTENKNNSNISARQLKKQIKRNSTISSK
jgi:hypothetical protein